MQYKYLYKQVFSNGKYSIVPIRMEDRFAIMKWRNEQIYHLRQVKPLTEEDQDRYFVEVVSKLFDQDHPSEMLFSYLEGDKCIGYGGLVHINWVDKNAEISFIMDTSLERDFFGFHWSSYLSLIENVAFGELKLHKLYTFAFDLRPHLYPVLETAGYEKEAVLKDHCLFNGHFKDVVVHAKISESPQLRKATTEDAELTFLWASDPEIRKYSFSKAKIDREMHQKWYLNKLNDVLCKFFILMHDGSPIGSIRFDIENGNLATVSYLIDPVFQGRGYGKLIIRLGIQKLKLVRPTVDTICGFVLNENFPSIKIFERLGFLAEKKELGQTKFIKNIGYANRR